jgi:hypothetical protein
MRLIAILVCSLFVTAAFAHDHEHPENNACLAGLENKSGVSCCDGQDATRVDDADWDSKDGHYIVKLDGEWVDVPDNALIKGQGCPGPTRVWTMHMNGKLYPRCFAPGAGG